MTYATINPFTNEQIRTYPDATDEDLEQVLTLDKKLYQYFKK